MAAVTGPTTTAIAPPSVIRALAGAVALIVLIDTATVLAPGLGLLAVPFIIAALRYKRGTWWGSALVFVWAALFVVIGVAFIAANGFDAGWGDLLFAWAGTPVALALAVSVVRHLVTRRRG